MSLFNQSNITNFILEVSDNGLTEAFKLNAQSVIIPAVRITPSDVPGSTQGIHRAQLPGSSISFDPLIVNILVDENLQGWLGIYKWMLSLNNYVTHDSKAWHPRGTPKAVTVHILDNSKTKIVMSIHYYDAWPSDLGELEYNLTEDGDPKISCMVTLPFKSFAVEIDGTIVEGRPQLDNVPQGGRVSMHPSMRN